MIEYEKEYEEYQKRIRTIITNRIRDYYSAQKSADWNFGVTHEEIRNYLTQKLLPKIFLVSNSDLRELRGLFDLRTTLFGKNNVNLIFERKIVPKFNTLDKNDYPKNYHIKKLLIQIILVNVINDIDRLLQNNCRLFQLHFDNQDYTNFEIVQYNDLLERTSIYKTLLKKYQPEEYNAVFHPVLQEKENKGDKIIHKKLDASQIVLLLDKLFGYYDKWEDANDSRKAEVISHISGTSIDNIRKKLKALEDNKNELSEKFENDQNLTDEIIKNFLGR